MIKRPIKTAIIVDKGVYDELKELRCLVKSFMENYSKTIFVRGDSAEMFTMIQAQLDCIDLEESVFSVLDTINNALTHYYKSEQNNDNNSTDNVDFDWEEWDKERGWA